ncbi:hypothetical protein BH11PLA2_BH11PLA2_10460 [soil metagenome]
MEPLPDHWFDTPAGTRSLPAYFLGQVPMEEFLPWQRRLAFEVSGDTHRGALIVCEHPPGITVGRDGSRVHIRYSRQHLQTQGWEVRWVARGGGVLLHLPGQIAIYPLLSFSQLYLTPTAFRDAMQKTVMGVLAKYVPNIRTQANRSGLFVSDRLIAHTGLSIRNNFTSFGMTVNVNPDLDLFHNIWTDGDAVPMTSLQRESPLRIWIPTLRQQLAEAVAASFGFDKLSVFHHHPALKKHDANAATY